MSTNKRFPIGLHIHLDFCDNHHVERAILYYQRTGAGVVNITAGARFTQAMQLAERFERDMPWVTVILRKWEGIITGTKWEGQIKDALGAIAQKLPDNGIHKLLTPQQWFDIWIAPHLDWIKAHPSIIWMTDNESSAGDMRPYALWMAEQMELCNPASKAFAVPLAVGRFPMGNPDIPQYPQLEPMFRGLAKHKNCVWSPNAGFAQTAELSNSLPDHFQHGLAFCDSKGIPRPRVIVGEFGVAKAWWDAPGKQGVDAECGFRCIGIPEREYAEQFYNNVEAWVASRGAEVCAYALGISPQYGSFHIWVDWMEWMEEKAKSYAPPPPITPPAPPPPVEPKPPQPPKPPEVPIPPAPVLKTYTFPLTIEIEAFDRDTALEMARAMVHLTRNGYDFAVGALVLYPLLARVKDVQMVLGVTEGE